MDRTEHQSQSPGTPPAAEKEKRELIQLIREILPYVKDDLWRLKYQARLTLIILGPNALAHKGEDENA